MIDITKEIKKITDYKVGDKVKIIYVEKYRKDHDALINQIGIIKRVDNKLDCTNCEKENRVVCDKTSHNQCIYVKTLGSTSESSWTCDCQIVRINNNKDVSK